MGDLMRCEFRHDLEAYLRDGGRAETLRDIVAYYEAHPEPMMAYGNAVLRAALGRPEISTTRLTGRRWPSGISGAAGCGRPAAITTRAS